MKNYEFIDADKFNKNDFGFKTTISKLSDTETQIYPSASLASVVLTLRCLKSDRRDRSLGHAAHALFKGALKLPRNDHSSNQTNDPSQNLNAFSVSPLYDGNSIVLKEKRQLIANHYYLLRFTTLNHFYTQAINEAISFSGAMSVGKTIDLDGIPFEIMMVATRPDQHPLANQADCGSIGLNWLYGFSRPESKFTFDFISPTFFTKGNLLLPLPYPDKVFESLLNRWNEYAILKLPEAIIDDFGEEIVFNRYKLHTEITEVKGGSFKRNSNREKTVIKPGALGQVVYEAKYADEKLLLILNLLSEFSIFSPVGAMTSFGFGQIQYIKNHNKQKNRRR